MSLSAIQSMTRKHSGRKCNDLDLSVLSQSFINYRKAVNMILQTVFSDSSYAESLGRELDESNGMLYVILRKEHRFKWKTDNKFGKLVYERMHRNALETAGRIIYADYTRRRLVSKLLEILASNNEQVQRLVINRRIPSDLIRLVRDTIEKKSSGDYHYALSACKQVRRVLRLKVREAFPIQEGERSPTTREILEHVSSKRFQTQTLLLEQISEWKKNGFPFIIPTFQKDTMDFAASTENTTGQGYWFKQDSEKENEIIFYIKTPPGVLGHDHDSTSPYKSQTLRLRFLNWLPRKANRARRKAKKARELGNSQRAIQLEYRAVRLEDMNHQLTNTIRLQRYTRMLAREKAQSEKNDVLIADLKSIVQDLKQSRRAAPPLIKVVGKQVTLYIPFMAPEDELLKISLSNLSSREKIAGVDRGLRHSMVVSIKNGEDDYEETMIGRQELFEKRERLRQQTRVLMSQITLKRNNWERKHPGLQPPTVILKKERELESVWQKVRRLDKEISHQVASETVWVCENQGVKTVYFEDLRSFQGKGGMRKHSWNLSTNLWGMMIEGVRYRRDALGHRNGGIWLVNPAWTSQTCHVCNERGVRVEDENSTSEKKGGEYFYCRECLEHFHADINAARNIMHVKQLKSSVVSGRTA
ncbi:MAG: transposase [Candidatus Thorarchaeota archaeon]|nr:transposase [Candidatus Thorarchaeota archaeon]